MDKFLFGCAIFLGAFLLFDIQPVIAKVILPWFGGSAAVWTTCMLFFQSVLLLGYLYAHWINRAGLFRLHAGVLAGSILLVRAYPDERWRYALADPAQQILAVLAAGVGLPALVLATTSPLVQSWYTERYHGALPYRFYALSNLASMSALIGYPTLLEPWLSSRLHLRGWAAAYAVYAVICCYLALRTTRVRGRAFPARDHERPEKQPRLLWFLLAAAASFLLVALTNHLCQNVASIPFLWILPLSVYLLTLIVCFDSDRWYRRSFFVPLNAAALAGLAYILVKQTPETSLKLLIPAFAAALFAACMYLHGELARRRPAPRHLTGFYLIVAAGGAFGSLLVGMVAPRLFSGYMEFAVALVACVLIVLLLEYGRSVVKDLALACVAIGVIAAAGGHFFMLRGQARVMVRNFYGGLRVIEQPGPPPRVALIHGAISHGAQVIESPQSPTVYYAPGTGVHRALEHRRGPSQRVGVIGLGVGTLAAYGRAGDTYRFYEINPLVRELAYSHFSYLRDSRAKVEVVIGDGRLSLEREQPNNFDVLVLDAFSGDSIPVHLLTREAFAEYFRHIRPGGLLALHISNSALDLRPVVAGLSRSFGRHAVEYSVPEDAKLFRALSMWAIVAASETEIAGSDLARHGQPMRPFTPRLWTDDYSNLFQVLR